MAASILTQGLTAIRDALKASLTYLCMSTDTSAFDAADTGINHTAAGPSVHVGAATLANVSGAVFDATLVIDGTTTFTGVSIACIGLATGVGVCKSGSSGGTYTGGAVDGTATVNRLVRASAIPVASGDSITIGVRVTVSDGG